MAIEKVSMWTQEISAEFVVIADYNLIFISIKAVSGGCTVLGSKRVGPFPSTAITLNEGDSLTVESPNGGAVLDGITITPDVAGSVALMAQ